MTRSFWTSLIALLPWIGGAAAATQPAAVDEDALWQQVYAAREAYYAETVGPLPEDIFKLGHMIGVWPGGGLFRIPADKLGPEPWVYTTFGLSNPDMPPAVEATDIETDTDAQGRIVRTESTLRAKAQPPQRTAGVAGYGYELIVATHEANEWPLWILQWAANAEILNDAGLLARMDRYGGLTVEDVQVGKRKDDTVHLLIARARAPLPTGTELPNGRMDILVATVITEAEMRWSMKNGREALLERLIAGGVGQFSRRDRASVVE
jgi:hypothetical protein